MLRKYACLLAVCALLLGLFACATSEEVASEPVVSEVVEDSVSVEVSEEVVSEEISEEVVEEEFYSAEEVMTLIDELTAKYQYDNPEHMKAMVIAANLDYITEEELNTILTTYGYAMEDLVTLYNEGVMNRVLSLQDTYSYYSGTTDNILPEQEYTNRVALADVMLNENDKQFAASFDDIFSQCSHVDTDATLKIFDLSAVEYTTSGEQVVVNIAYYFTYGEATENPYAAY